jgi:hypothetical protein
LQVFHELVSLLKLQVRVSETLDHHHHPTIRLLHKAAAAAAAVAAAAVVVVVVAVVVVADKEDEEAVVEVEVQEGSAAAAAAAVAAAAAAAVAAAVVVAILQALYEKVLPAFLSELETQQALQILGLSECLVQKLYCPVFCSAKLLHYQLRFWLDARTELSNVKWFPMEVGQMSVCVLVLALQLPFCVY